LLFSLSLSLAVTRRLTVTVHLSKASKTYFDLLHIMGRVSTGGSIKKTKQKSAPNSPIGKLALEESAEASDDATSVTVMSVIFQHDNSASDECSACDILLPPSIMSSRRLKPGTFVSLRLLSGSALCRVWSHKRMAQLQTTDTVLLNKIWQPNVTDERKVVAVDFKSSLL
jgi:hypothetical protein